MSRKRKQRESESPVAPQRSRWPLAVVVVLAVCSVVLATQWSRWFSPESTEREPLKPPEVTEGTIPADVGQSFQAMDNPARDGWDTEVFSQQADKALKILAGFVARPKSIEAKALAPLLAEEFACAPLLPKDRTVAFSDGSTTVERSRKPVGGKSDQAYEGPAGCAEALKDWLAPFAEASGVRAKFKLFRVARNGDTVTTRQYVSVSARLKEGMIEQNATWEIRWNTSADSPSIAAIDVVDFEQVVYKNAAGAMFADCTRSVLKGNDSYQRQFLTGWGERLSRSQDVRYSFLLGNPGLAVGDVNGDGLDDLYVCQEEGLPNRLFLQNKDGTATDVSRAWGGGTGCTVRAACCCWTSTTTVTRT